MRYHYLTACLVLLMACGKETSIPSEIIQPDKMVNILIDVHQADAKVSNLRILEDSAYVLMRHYDLAIYREHGVSEDDYRTSYQWYLQHPEVYKDLYVVVVDSLAYYEETVKPTSESTENQPTRTNATPSDDEE